MSKIFDYIELGGACPIEAWSKNLQPKQRAKLDQKVDMLRLHGETIYPNVLTDTPQAGVLKLRVHGNVQLRPLLCRGPVDVKSEYTFLAGAKEVQSKLVPPGVLSEAARYKEELVADPHNRRKKHE